VFQRVPQSDPYGKSPVSAGVPVIERDRLCPEAKQVARLSTVRLELPHWDGYAKVSQTAVSELTPIFIGAG